MAPLDTPRVGRERIDQDAAASEAARTELHSPLEPAERLPGGQQFDGLADWVIHLLMADPLAADQLFDLVRRVLGPPKGVVHLDARRLGTEQSQCRADAKAAVSGAWRNVDPLDGRLIRDAGIQKRVVREAARKDEIRYLVAGVHVVDNRQHDLLGQMLNGSRDILMTAGDFLFRLSLRTHQTRQVFIVEAADVGRGLRPRRADSVFRVEVLEVQLQLAVFSGDDRTEAISVFRVPERREPHHLALVAIAGESEKLRDHCVEKAD